MSDLHAKHGIATIFVLQEFKSNLETVNQSNLTFNYEIHLKQYNTEQDIIQVAVFIKA